MLYKTIMVIFLSVFGFSLNAQEMSGYVKDKKSGDPIPFVNIWFKGTSQGTISDENGYFELPASTHKFVSFSSVGYVRKEVSVKKFSKEPLTVLLAEDMQRISEVTVKPEVSRAKVLFKQILKNKKNNRERVQNIHNYKSFARTTVYVALDSTSRASRFIDNLDEVTMKIDGQNLRFSPIYLAELAKQNGLKTDNVVYEKKDGIFPKLNQTIESLILLNVVVDLNFYDDQIDILGRGITSPISNSARMHYDIYLNDSTLVDSTWNYSFSFTPKNKYNALFTGRFTVEGKNFALTRVFAYVQQEANINFVNGFKANVNYRKLENSDTWFYDEQNISLSLSLTLNKDSVSRYDSQRIDQISSGNWMVNKTTQYSTSLRLENVEAREWKNQPEFASNLLAEDNYQRVDKLKENSVVRGIDAIGGMVLTSYIDLGKIEVGPVFDIYSTNAIEGSRFTLPLRTGEKLWERFTVGGFVGYGTKNKEFQYGANAAWQLQESDKFILRTSYSDDYTLVSQDKYLRFIKKNPNTRGNGNFIAAITSQEENPFLKEEKSINAIFEFNADKNFSVEASGYYLASKQTPAVHFARENVGYQSYSNYGVLLNWRLAFGQYYDKYYFSRVYYIDQIPVINLSLDMGKVHLPGENTPDLGLYTQIHGSIVGKVNMGQTFLRYMLNGGYLIGDAPYDLLDQPVGSMSLGFAKYRFNLLHHAAFAHNLYTNLHLDYTLGGLFLNRIPLIKKLKLREMVSLKAHYGNLTSAYKPVFDLPDYFSNEQNTPYAEIGVGLTNIFKVLRVEYVHLLGNTYANSNFTDRSGIRFRAEMSF